MLNHQVLSPPRSISWCVFLDGAGGPQADPGAGLPVASVGTKKTKSFTKSPDGSRGLSGALPYRFISAFGSEKVVTEVKESKDAAGCPHVDAVTERQAEEDLWSSV